jgi:hypothetical protein
MKYFVKWERYNDFTIFLTSYCFIIIKLLSATMTGES